MVQIIDRGPSIGGALGQALGQAGGNIFAGYEAQSLQNKMQEFKDLETRQKGIEKLPANIDAFLRQTGRKEYQSEERDRIRALANELIEAGSDPTSSVEQAVTIFENPEAFGISEETFRKPKKEFTGRGKPSALSPEEPRRFQDDLSKLFGLDREPSAQEKSVRKKAKTARSLGDFSESELFLLRPSDIEHLPESEQKKFYEQAPALAKEATRIMESAAIPFIGGAVSERAAEERGAPIEAPPIATLSRILSELPFLGPAIGVGALPAQAARGAALFGGATALEEGVRALGTDKRADVEKMAASTLIGAAFPYAEKALGVLGGKLKDATKALMRRGKTGIEAAAEVTEGAVKAGVDLEKVAANDAKEVSKLENYLGRIGKIKEPKPKEVKPSRVFKEAKKVAPEAEAKVFEKQLKEFDKVEGEIAKQSEKIEKLASRTKLPSTLAKESNLRKVAQSVLPSMEKEYTLVSKERARLADEFATYKGPHKDRLEALMKDAVDAEKEAGESLKNAIYQSRVGKTRPTSKDLSEQAEEAVQKLMKDAKDPSKKVDDLVSRYNADRVKEGKRLLRNKKLPGDIYDDTYTKVMKEYIKKYEARANELKDLLTNPRMVFGMKPQNIKVLEKEFEALKRAIDRDTSNLMIHQREIGLKEIARRKGVQKQMAKLKPKEIPESMKPTQQKMLQTINRGERLGKAVKDIKGANFEKATSVAGMNKKESTSFGDALREIRGINKKKFNTIDQARKHIKSKMTEFLKPLKNQFAVGIALGLLDPIMRETTGKKIPGKLKTAFLAGIFGIPTRGGQRHPAIALTAYVTDNLAKSYFLNKEAKKISKLSGQEYLKEVNDIRKSKRFTPKEIKEILEKRKELKKAA